MGDVVAEFAWAEERLQRVFGVKNVVGREHGYNYVFNIRNESDHICTIQAMRWSGKKCYRMTEGELALAMIAVKEAFEKGKSRKDT